MIVFGPAIPPDQREPIGLLGVSPTDPIRYKVFKGERRIAGDFKLAGKQFTVLHATSAWKDFVETLTALDRIDSDTDAGDTEEAWDEIMRGLESGRSSDRMAIGKGR